MYHRCEGELEMIKQHVKYLHSFGTERLKQYRKNLGKLCLKIELDWIDDKQTLEEFLKENNLWYTLYL